MNAKEYLSQMRCIKAIVAIKQEQIEELRVLAEKASAAISNTPPGGTRNVNRMEDIIVKMVDLQNEMQTDYDNLITLKKDISAAIRAVSCFEHRALLEMRYLHFSPWSVIADTLHYSKPHVMKLHKTALSAVKVPSN